tara:strand:+ start:747 stop:1337 length:591 start_codon:yes stop_codon:yes gene_type:complete
MSLEKRVAAYNAVEFVNIQEDEPKPEEMKVVEQDQQNQSQSKALTQPNDPIMEKMKLTKNTKKEPKGTVKGELGIPKGPDMGTIVEIKPDNTIEEFPPIPTNYIGGAPAMQKFINENVRYPEIDRISGEQGIVYVSFVIEKDGSVSNVKIARGVTKTIDREAKRIVRSFPKWKPAENAYGKVRTRVRLPIGFTLGG